MIFSRYIIILVFVSHGTHTRTVVYYKLLHNRESLQKAIKIFIKKTWKKLNAPFCARYNNRSKLYAAGLFTPAGVIFQCFIFTFT